MNHRDTKAPGKLIAVCFGALVVSFSALAQETRIFSLADRVSVSLSADWTERRNEDPPPPNQLLGSAPKVVFSDILVLENRKVNAVLKLAVSENPFLGSNAPALDARMHAGEGRSLVNHLFFFFFPPPPRCLVEAKTALEAARREEEARREQEEEKDKDKKGKKEKRAPSIVAVSRPCEFAAAPLDFYAEQVSPGVTLNSNNAAQGMLRSFYVPPMEQVELAGKTFFIFEAQGRDHVERAHLDKSTFPRTCAAPERTCSGPSAPTLPFPLCATRSARTCSSSTSPMPP